MNKAKIGNALKAYRDNLRTARNKIAQAKKDYVEPKALSIENELKGQIDAERKGLVALIREEQESEAQAALEWAKIDGAKITDDAKVFGLVDVSQADLDAMIERNRDNGTMMTILKRQAEEYNKTLVAKTGRVFPEGMLNTSNIPTAEKRIADAEKDAKHAYSVLNMIEGGGSAGYIGGVDSELTEEALRIFTEE